MQTLESNDVGSIQDGTHEDAIECIEQALHAKVMSYSLLIEIASHERFLMRYSLCME